MNARSLAVSILEQFDRRRCNLQVLVDRELNRSSLDHRDRRFVFELVYGVMRYRTKLDYLIRHFLTDDRLCKNDFLMRILQLGIYQIMFLDRVPDHAAVNESVKLAKVGAKTAGYTKLVNGVLRAVIASGKKVPLPDAKEGLARRLSIEYAHPEWMVERWLSAFGLANTRKLLVYNNKTPSIYLRRKIRGLPRAQFESESRSLCRPVGGYQDAYYVLDKSIMPEKIGLLRQGHCIVQAPSSGWVVALLGIKAGECCADLCSAPGGKAVFMAELAGGQGSVCACEISHYRIKKMLENIGRMALGTIHPLVCDARRIPFDGFFDKVLLDAPCTGTGVIQRHPDARGIRCEDDVGRMAVLQRELLDAAADIVGPGGVLVYATCSLESPECEEQVEQFLKRHQEFSLERPPSIVPEHYIDLNGFLRITPYEHEMDGMFAARLVKKGSHGIAAKR